MQLQHDRDPWNVRALLEASATPFTIADYGPRAVIFRQGDPCDSAMHIERGRVWLAVTARSGKEAICGLLGTGAFLGEEALVGRGERRQSVIAMTATQVLVVAKAHMIRLLHTQPGLIEESSGVLQVNPARLHVAERHLEAARSAVRAAGAPLHGLGRQADTKPHKLTLATNQSPTAAQHLMPASSRSSIGMRCASSDQRNGDKRHA